MVEPINNSITAWMPETDRHTLAVLGKLAEEAAELAARASRSIIQGLDGIDPDSGRTNREELGREAADVLAALQILGERHGIAAPSRRAEDKIGGFRRWHDLIDDEEARLAVEAGAKEPANG